MGLNLQTPTWAALGEPQGSQGRQPAAIVLRFREIGSRARFEFLIARSQGWPPAAMKRAEIPAVAPGSNKFHFR